MKTVFVAYPYNVEGYRDAIADAGKGLVTLVYADEVLSNQHILEKITGLMKSADLCLFDLTGGKANVALELGVAIGNGFNYRILLDVKAEPDVFSDMRGWDQLRYLDLAELADKLDALFRSPETFHHRDAIRLTDQEFEAQPNMHIDLHQDISGPDGSFLSGTVRNVGNGVAHQPMLRLPGFEDIRLGGIMKRDEPVPLQRMRYDNKDFYTKKLEDSTASVEFGDMLGNLYRQEGQVTQSLTPGGVIFTYSINSFGLPRKVKEREIPVQ